MHILIPEPYLVSREQRPVINWVIISLGENILLVFALLGDDCSMDNGYFMVTQFEYDDISGVDLVVSIVDE